MHPSLLRKQAEAKWLAKFQVTAPVSANEVQAVLHELGVHQIELEMQNEELLRLQILAEQSQARYQALYDFAPVGYCTLCEAGLIVQANQTLATLLGVERSQLLATPLTDFVFRDDQDTFYLMRQQFQAGTTATSELRMLQLDAAPFWAQLTASNPSGTDDSAQWHLVIQDISARKQQDEQLRESQERWRFAIEGCGDALWDWNTQTGTVFYSPRFKEMLGYSDADFGGITTQWSTFVHSEDKAKIQAELKNMLEGAAEAAELEFRVRCKDGHYQWMLGRGMVIQRDANSKALRIIGTNSDITERKQHELQLEYMAHFDALTNLPNRVLFIDRLSHAIAQATRQGNTLAVVYLDLDGFKVVNDAHGHDIGDKALNKLALSLRNAMREADTLGRIGGDEFVAVLDNLASPQDCLPMLNRMLEAAEKPMLISDQIMVHISASIGVAFYPQDQYIDPEQLLRQADQAMYQAKLAGKNCYHFFDSVQDSHIRSRHKHLEHIRQALVQREFVLHYQPKVNMRSGTVVGVEALIRWQHPQRGLLPPAEFLPDIEDHSLSVDVGDWVINEALCQLESWRAAGLNLTISVNISARQLQQDDFIERLHSILAQHSQVTPGSLEFEILETSALEDIVKVSSVISACALLGITFALDDFGTGYSSLTYLKRLPVALLKIDQSFVRDMLEDADNLAILRGIIGLASAFNTKVIAEGVETIAHGTELLCLGCDLGQGYGIARPMPAAQLPEWLSRWQPDAAWRALSRA